MSEPYDVVIIGGGPGGYNCAIRAGQLGLKVAIVEKRGRLGGTCLNVGCIPSKALLHASELYEAADKEFAGLGIRTGGLELDLPQMLKQKDEAVDGLTKGIEFLMKKNKVDYLVGKGRIAGAGKVEVETEEGKQTLDTKHIVIATGSEVTPLPGVEIDEKRVVSSTGALSLEKVPGKLVLIGAGVIGLELGSVWRRLGADVTVVEYLDRILPGMDGELAKNAQRIFAKQGMEFHLSTKVTGVDASDADTLKVTIEPAEGGEARTLEADTVLVCIGRRPYTEGLGLENVGIETDKRGVIANDHFRTSAENVWVIGDCTSGPMLAHKAEDEGTACAERIAGKAGHVNYGVIPGVVYTAPEIAAVGKTEEELKAEGRKYKKGKFPFQANSRARTNHQTEGFVKILADAGTDEILGAHMIGANVGEMIAEICLAMEFQAASEDIARTCHPHPTLTEAIRQAAMGVEGWTMQA
ncbi:MAG: dihydrolipoyl dehydrogenase [Oceanicaulis sp.]|uniref:Dihydrolipoyl dehydrogenase n=1 Tax=Maricaulis virginensis TaxID=144022 RepID=A0A9W6IMG9_9PROT|nr:dihydrolipoyl dehydrogenase [Maricaulis virginensis]MAC39093.1 dihydrolipoyl dehydrogenase [Oceanicaulis sp.]MAZ91092.1 dihydrolipoyl dehydrogenase [Maricaulis sp.]MBI74180.1 dihydrolipoyl dehydrogenase [Oceanicaulis sp.]GLK52703.1 dihydrolipoyl dehydrogenase [Maricaulis virginensis]